MRSRIIGLITLLIGLSLTSSCYQGDGNFHRRGIWPMAVYSLELKPFKLEPGTAAHFRLRGWRSNKYTFVKLAVTAPRPMAFDESDLALAVTIKDRDGKSVLALQPELAAHLRRMRDAGDALVPENEWQCHYDWGDNEVMERAVPFIPGKSPLPQAQLECWDLVELPERYYDIDVRCVQCPRSLGLQAKLSLTSGPK